MLTGKSAGRGVVHPNVAYGHVSLRATRTRTVFVLKSNQSNGQTESEATLRIAEGASTRGVQRDSTSTHQSLYNVAELPAPLQNATSKLQEVPQGAWVAAAAVGLTLAGLALKKDLDTPSRAYDNNVGQEYDNWTNEGILEHYWGDHIHLGYYSEAERAAGYKKKDFKKAKLDFVDEMLRFSGVKSFTKVLDVGCGFGGTSRHLAYLYPNATVEGITLSKEQVKRGTELAQERNLTNVSFKVMDALNMTYPDNSFDLVWACESGEHMPDKKKYIEEMTRVLKPGGTLVIACWCQREETPTTRFTEKERKDLKFLYEEWAHPYFISIEEFVRLMKGTGQLEDVRSADWTRETIPSWRHSVWVGVWSPWYVLSKMSFKIWYKILREIVTLERMHQAFDKGLMQYGMMRAVKTDKGTLSSVKTTAF